MASSPVSAAARSRTRSARATALVVAVPMLIVLRAGSLGFALAASHAVGTGTSTAAHAASGTFAQGLRGAARFAPQEQPRATSSVPRGDGDMAMVTAGSCLAGIAVGVLIARLTQEASEASQDRISDGMKASLSADAGMEDVEDEDDAKTSEVLIAMAKAQGMKTDVVKKMVEDDGW
eukprot:CAMPEP_0117538686 /NCGR_PEP_ID=MMETSP0784-20121206/42606_1 /TAXON_ID=39447 /ORGANISM="" /LENGTH=176 /DNA_ID=CAMNT_0005335307 /DNA_START=74 /DNA_END=604 /DNA_ORIENTATION=-